MIAAAAVRGHHHPMGLVLAHAEHGLQRRDDEPAPDAISSLRACALRKAMT
jgi:hypothetical protein